MDAVTTPVRNELCPSLLGPNALNPAQENTNANRGHMVSVHLGQRLVIEGATPRRWQSGVESDWGKYTFNVAIPKDATILACIPRYAKTAGNDGISHNPETAVIYEEYATKKVGVIILTDFCRNHQYFGFKFNKTEAIKAIRPGASFSAGTTFLKSPAVLENDEYAFGIQANIAYMTHPACSEDGILVNSEFLKKLKFRTYETYTIQWGRKESALNIYGTLDNPKVFPDIGQTIREDGLVMCLRPNDRKELFVAERSKRAMMTPSLTFDRGVYATPGGKVVDVSVQHRRYDSNIAAVNLDAQAQYYYEASRNYHQKILDLINTLSRQRGSGLDLTRELHQLVVHSEAVCSDSLDKKIHLQYRNVPLDTYSVDITIEYEITPTIGFKLTDFHGGKGVFCRVVPPEMMPIDQNGVRADVCMDPNGTINRANVGRLIEQYCNAAGFKEESSISEMLGIPKRTKYDIAEKELRKIVSTDPNKFEQVWAHLMGFYEHVSPSLYEMFQSGQIPSDTNSRVEYLAEFIQEGWGIYRPVNQQVSSQDVIYKTMNSQYAPFCGPVTFIGENGEHITTKESILIGEVYFGLLEKTGDDWAAVSTARTNMFGIPAPLTRADRNAKPIRHQPPRGDGEAEGRIFVSNMSEWFVPEMRDRNNSPETLEIMCTELMTVNNPSNVENLVDRSKHKYGTNRAIQVIHHDLQVSGVELRYREFRS